MTLFIVLTCMSINILYPIQKRDKINNLSFHETKIACNCIKQIKTFYNNNYNLII